MFMDIADVQVAKDKDKNLILPREHYSDHVATNQTSEYYWSKALEHITVMCSYILEYILIFSIFLIYVLQ